MSSKRRSYSPEYREQAVKMVVETSRPTAQIARELGIGEQTLGNWVANYRRDHAGGEPALNLDERAQLEELKRQARELKMENEFLKMCGVLCSESTVTEKYEFIESQKVTEKKYAYPVEFMCGRPRGVQVGVL